MCNKCADDRETYLEMCNEVLSNWDNDWAWDTINSIKEWIENNNHITEKQMNAITNIYEKCL